MQSPSRSVPRGWFLVFDSPTQGLRLESSVIPGSIAACLNAQPSKPNEDVRIEGVGSSARELADWLVARPDLTVTSGVETFTLDRLSGWWIKVTTAIVTDFEIDEPTP